MGLMGSIIVLPYLTLPNKIQQPRCSGFLTPALPGAYTLLGAYTLPGAYTL